MKAITYNLSHDSKNQHDNPEQKIVNLLEQMFKCKKAVAELSNSNDLESTLHELKLLGTEAIKLAGDSTDPSNIIMVIASIDSIHASLEEKKLPNIEQENNIASEIIQDFKAWSKGNRPLILAVHSAQLGLSPSSQDIQLFKQITPHELQGIKNRIEAISQLYKDNTDLSLTQLRNVEKQYNIIANFFEKIIIFNLSTNQNMIEDIKKYNDLKFNYQQATPDQSDVSKNQSEKPPSTPATSKTKSFVQTLEQERAKNPRNHNRTIY